MNDRCRIITADVLDGLAQLPSESVHCCITSPPYWGLRDYGTPGQLGLEPTPQAYICNMVAVFEEVRRVMRPDATLWLNMGDSYANDAKWGGSTGGKHVDSLHGDTGIGRRKVQTGLKPKDLCGMPWRLALALQEAGWWLRCDIIWAKPNPMPERVTDRPTKSHEYLFLLAKSPRYYFDQEAVRERGDNHAGGGPIIGDHRLTSGTKLKRGLALGTINRADRDIFNEGGQSRHGNALEAEAPRGSRNIRSVWTIPTEPYAAAHFATYPQALVKPCVLAGTSERGCCGECGAPWVRQVVPGKRAGGGAEYRPGDPSGATTRRAPKGGQKQYDNRIPGYSLGFAPSCTHAAEVVPATILDCFMGSGTTGLVALGYGRNFVGVEINPDYVALAEKRLAPVLAQEILL